MRVLVTGGSGKLGHAVMKELVSTPATGRGVAELVSVDLRSRGDHKPADGAARYVVADVKDPAQLMDVMPAADAVIHLAGYPRPGLVPSAVLFEENVRGAYSVHKYGELAGAQTVVSASSTAVIGWTYRSREVKLQSLPVDESHPLAPQDEYGLGKLVMEQVAQSFSLRTEMTTIALRPPWLVSESELADLRRVGGRASGCRDLLSYLSVRDAARAIVAALGIRDGRFHAVYVAADDSSSGEDTRSFVRRCIGDDAMEASHGLGPHSPLISNSGARDLLGWEPLDSWRSE